MKRAISMLLIAATLVLLGGCVAGSEPEPGSSPLGAYSDREEEQEPIPTRDHISLIYYADMDSNPLTAANSANHELLKLVYSPLIRLNGTLKAEYVLAESVVVKGTKVTVTLKKDLKFSDGSKVTAADVEESIQIIRNNPASPYYNRLTNIRSYTPKNSRTLSITLYEADIDFINCLDIPVVKKGKQIGCGPYRFSAKGGAPVLVPNKHYFAQPSIKTIYLKAPKNDRERQNMFSVGLLDVYFDTAENEQVFAGGKAYKVQTYPGDNLLFLGINCGKGLLKSAKFRYFLNQVTARHKLVESVLLGQAEAARYPYQPSWYKSEQTVDGDGLSDTEKRTAAEALGLKVTEKALLYKGKQISFRLLVSKGNDVHMEAATAVAEGLAVAGIQIKIQAVSRADYDARLAAGDFDLYLGEIKTGRTLNPSLYTAGSPINFSGATFAKLEQAAANYRSGKLLLTDFCTIYDQYTPILPLAYRGGALFAAADIGEFKSTGSWALYGDITKLETETTK